LETVEGLPSAVKTLTTDKTMKARARALEEKISSEDGVARPVEIFDPYTKNSLQVSF
jgi:UDP:flavonoid glycosyltransferase YjiC (YdhE family)